MRRMMIDLSVLHGRVRVHASVQSLDEGGEPADRLKATAEGRRDRDETSSVLVEMRAACEDSWGGKA